ncbi:MAG TPA: DNA polymerase III subunit delta' [Burkholderiaceae bacterium]|nr:DNA polymerase III subunit delta' [Burkholderiaceae bacterium]
MIAIDPPWLARPLADAIGHRAHALLVHGPAGIGQFEFGLLLSQARLCETPLPQGPCGECTGCHLMKARSHPDFFLLVPDAIREGLGWNLDDGKAEGDGKKTKPSREIKVDAIRTAIAWTQQSSSRGRGKVLLIHPAHAMNPTSANALLKTLEEPPSGVRMLLCTSDPELLLPTIRSRCQRWRLSAPGPDEALAWLERQGLAGADVMLTAAGGLPVEAMAMAAEGIDAERWKRLPGAVAHGDSTPLSGLGVPRVVDALQKLCHDAMAVAAGGAPRFFHAVPPSADLDALVSWAKSLSRTARHDEHPWNVALLVDALVAEARACWPRQPVHAGRRLTRIGASP